MSASTVREMFPRKPGSVGLHGRQTLLFYRQYWKVVVTHRHAQDHDGISLDLVNGDIVKNLKCGANQSILVFEGIKVQPSLGTREKILG